MDRVQNKPNSSVQHTPSSESFQVYLSCKLLRDALLVNATAVGRWLVHHMCGIHSHTYLLMGVAGIEKFSPYQAENYKRLFLMLFREIIVFYV
jgi:hypothetical protein